MPSSTMMIGTIRKVDILLHKVSHFSRSLSAQSFNPYFFHLPQCLEIALNKRTLSRRWKKKNVLACSCLRNLSTSGCSTRQINAFFAFCELIYFWWTSKWWSNRRNCFLQVFLFFLNMTNDRQLSLPSVVFLILSAKKKKKMSLFRMLTILVYLHKSYYNLIVA